MRAAFVVAALVACGQPQPGPCEQGLSSKAGAAGGNVVVILLDDIGVERIAAWDKFDSPSTTPTLDALDDQSVRFTRAYATPSCSPTRAALLTGRRARRTGVGHWIGPEPNERGLPAEEQTIPEMLGDAAGGWSSALIGKWHLSVMDESAPDAPYDQGFDVFRGTLGNPDMALEPMGKDSRNYTHWEYWRDGERSVEERYLTTVTTDDAVEQLGALPEPFFLYVAYNAAHTPMHNPPPDLAAPAASIKARARLDVVIEALDAELGRLLAQVDLSDTTVILMSDNGTRMEAVRKPLDRQRAKGTVYDGGTHVPLWVLGAAVDRPGTASEALVHVTDVFATVADIAGVSLSALEGPIDGRSLVPHLVQEDAPARQCLVSETFPNNGHRKLKLDRAIQDRDFKLVRRAGARDELYDLRTSLGDIGDDLLAGKPSPQADKARDRLVGWLREDRRAVK